MINLNNDIRIQVINFKYYCLRGWKLRFRRIVIIPNVSRIRPNNTTNESSIYFDRHDGKKIVAANKNNRIRIRVNLNTTEHRDTL